MVLSLNDGWPKLEISSNLQVRASTGKSATKLLLLNLFPRTLLATNLGHMT